MARRNSSTTTTPDASTTAADDDAPTITIVDEAPAPEDGAAPILTEDPTPQHRPEPPAEVPPEPEVLERFRVETNVYYVPDPGHGSLYVPAGTIVTRVSHDLQKLITQGARLRPID